MNDTAKTDTAIETVKSVLAECRLRLSLETRRDLAIVIWGLFNQILMQQNTMENTAKELGAELPETPEPIEHAFHEVYDLVERLDKEVVEHGGQRWMVKLGDPPDAAHDLETIVAMLPNVIGLIG